MEQLFTAETIKHLAKEEFLWLPTENSELIITLKKGNRNLI